MATLDYEIIKIEGGYSNDPDDAGGETNHGISKRSHPKEDIKNLTIERALQIYNDKYWKPHRLSEIANQTTANIIFRFIVNASASTAITRVQRVLNQFTLVTIDGILGHETLRAINAQTPIFLQNALRVSICNYYLSIVTRKKSQKKYFEGWIKRALM